MQGSVSCFGSKCKGLQKIVHAWKNRSLFIGSRYLANVRYLYYRLFPARVTEAQANKVFRIACGAFNVSLGPRCAVNTAKNGVAPTKTTGYVNCRCGTWDPPDGCDEVSSLPCPGFSTWVHVVCYGMPDNSTFLCDQCKPNIEEGIDMVWSNANSMQRQLVKGLLDVSYGEGQASNFRVFFGNLGQEAIYVGRAVGDRFFGGFWCSAILLKHQAPIFLVQRVRELETKKKSPGNEEDGRKHPNMVAKTSHLVSL